MLVCKKGYMDLVRQFSREAVEACQKSGVDRRKLAERDKKIDELRLKLQLLVDDSPKV